MYCHSRRWLKSQGGWVEAYIVKKTGSGQDFFPYLGSRGGGLLHGIVHVKMASQARLDPGLTYNALFESTFWCFV
jgi:hypothetical protein